METLGNLFPANPAPKFYCDICDYGTCRKSNYDEHILTSKHKKRSNGNLCQSISSKNQQTLKYSCQFCGKEYNDNSGLWKHKQKCNLTATSNSINEPSDKELIMMLIKENSELKNMMFKVIENGTNTNNNNNNTINSHNKAFNLNVFLNETCKDAMNISDFVESVKLQVSDLEHVGNVGYI